MSTAADTPDDIPDATSHVEVLRFDPTAWLDMREATGVDGEYVWPVPPLHMANLFRASAEHGPTGCCISSSSCTA